MPENKNEFEVRLTLPEIRAETPRDAIRQFLQRLVQWGTIVFEVESPDISVDVEFTGEEIEEAIMEGLGLDVVPLPMLDQMLDQRENRL